MKYYTPEIEEFHVGFEFEFEDEDGGGWTKTIIEDQPSLCNWTGMLIDYRVKHLDREDIESLSKGKTNRGLFILKNSEFDHRRILCMTECNHVIIGNASKGKDYEQLFVGIVKNKSEFKRLLKQLDINDNN